MYVCVKERRQRTDRRKVRGRDKENALCALYSIQYTRATRSSASNSVNSVLPSIHTVLYKQQLQPIYTFPIKLYNCTTVQQQPTSPIPTPKNMYAKLTKLECLKYWGRICELKMSVFLMTKLSPLVDHMAIAGSHRSIMW